MNAIVHLIAAARPNFMKVAPLFHALKREHWCSPVLVHTGQHYDPEMSEHFLRDLGLSDPDIQLGVGSGSHAQQTAAVMVEYEKACVAERPDWVVVVGDVNSTVAAALVAKKLLLPVAHLEAGLRSRDRTMPEEINRIVTDAISDLLWTPSPDADENLLAEGVPAERIARVGNIMIDSLEMMRPEIEAARRADELADVPQRFGVVTLHRPSNVDSRETLATIVDALARASQGIHLVFPLHPRTRNRLEEFGLLARLESIPGLTATPPMSYVPFMKLVMDATLVLTDSGGLQEETTYLGIPCLTLRENTERPITISSGTNRLVAPDGLVAAVADAAARGPSDSKRPDLWDGRTADRVVASLRRQLDLAATAAGANP